MQNHLPLKLKITLICILLSAIPLLLVGATSLYQLQSYGRDISSEAYNALTDQTQMILKAGLKNDRLVVGNLIERSENDVRSLALSKSMDEYLKSKNKTNVFLSALAEQEATAVPNSIWHTCRAQQGLIQKKLESDMAVAEHVISARGGFEIEGLTHDWEVINQLTGDRKTHCRSSFQDRIRYVRYDVRFR
jgi:hypothetical protein